MTDRATGDFRRRAVSAAILGPVVLASVWYGGLPFWAVVLVTAGAALCEWLRMAGRLGRLSRLFWWTNLLGLATIALVALVWQVQVAVAAALPFLIGTAVILKLGGVRRVVIGVSGLPYVGAALLSLVWLRLESGTGWMLVVWLLLVVWATDIGGYVAGRAIGGPKFLPAISPKKTWAGVVGACVAAALVGWSAALALGAARPDLAIWVALAASVSAQAGDFFESAVKRHYGVKDSSRLIPGHGGVLDRVDGLLAAAPVVAILHAVLREAVAWW